MLNKVKKWTDEFKTFAIKGNVIDMALSALLAVGITLGSGVNATLSVKKLD